MIRALPMFTPIDWKESIAVNTCSNTNQQYKLLSPFVVSAPPAKRFENLWQFSKVYKKHLCLTGLPTPEWYQWRDAGFADTKAHRYPMGKGAIPEYSFWYGQKLSYVEARKAIYIPEYIKNVGPTDSFHRLQETYQKCLIDGKGLILLDYDGYDHRALGITLADVVGNPNKIMGHSFVLMMMLGES